MAISTIDGIIAGMKPPGYFSKLTGTMEAAGQMHSLFYTAGLPGAAAAPTPGLAGAALTSYAGQLPFSNPASGNTYIARAWATGGVAGTLLVCDRLWHNSGFTVTTTTAQAVGSATFPARDRNGATAGVGVLVGLEVSTATTNVGATAPTLSYTPAAGGGPNTATATFPATAAAGTFAPFNLAAGDTGVGAITSLTLNTSLVTGVVHLVAYRVLAEIPVPIANVGPPPLDFAQIGFPRLYDNTVPFLLWLPSATTTHTIQGSLTYTQG